MKILISDDAPARYERFVKQANLLGVQQDDIRHAVSISETRDALRSEHFDLLVLDLLIPAWPHEEERSSNHTIDLMRELSLDDEDMYRPDKIVGITQDKQIHAGHVREFEELAWTLLHYSSADDGWLNTLTSCVRYIAESKSKPPKRDYDVDVAIICALQNPELKAVLNLPWGWGSSPKPLDHKTFFWEGAFSTGATERRVVAACAPRMGMVSSALLSAKLVQRFCPRVLVMLGICGGIDGKAKIGDAIFAESVWDYQSGKHSVDNNHALFEMAPVQLAGDDEAAAVFRQLSSAPDKLARVASLFPGDAAQSHRLLVAPVASGSAVVADGEIAKEIIKQNRELRGIEMEIYGVYAAAYDAPKPQPRVFALKTVCDLANTEKNDSYQAFASFFSARLLELAVQEYPTQILGDR